jgi:hypothetical protein
MFLQRFVQQQFFEGIEVFTQSHFIKEQMNSIVTLPTNIDTNSELFALVCFLKKATPVHLFWYQMMKGECSHSPAQRTFTGSSATAMLGC